MMKRLFLFALLLAAIAAAPARAQYSAVSGTVTDPEGIPYAGATIKFQLSTPGATLTITDAAKCQSSGQGSAPCHVPIAGTYGPTTLDSTGSFATVVPDNASVLPASPSSVYLITVTITPGVAPPFGTGPQTFSTTQAITGASVNLGSTLSALTPALTNTIPGSGNVVATGTLTANDLVCGAGAKNVQDCGVALSAVALLASPHFTGVPTAPTAAPGTNTTQLATMAALHAAIVALPPTSNLLDADVTPLTVTGSAATSVNLKTFTFSAGALNSVGKTFAFQAHGAATPIASQSNICPTITLITIPNPASSFCDASYTTAATWGFSGTCTVVTAGATGELLCQLGYTVQTGPGNPQNVFEFQPFQWGGGLGTLDLTAAQTITIGWSWSPVNAGNSVVENNLYVQLLN